MEKVDKLDMGKLKTVPVYNNVAEKVHDELVSGIEFKFPIFSTFFINHDVNLTKAIKKRIEDVDKKSSESNGIGTHNHLVCERILNHLANYVSFPIRPLQPFRPVWLNG